ESVHPGGKFINHSTHSGFSRPPATVDRAVPPCEYAPLRWPVSSATGVGHIRSAVISRSERLAPDGRGPVAVSAPVLLSLACGVGHQEDSSAYMGGTDEGRRYAVPFRVIPEAGQVSENVSEPVTKESWNVFQEDEAWS